MESVKTALSDILNASLLSDVTFYGLTLPAKDKLSLASHLKLTDEGFRKLLLLLGFATMMKNGKIRNNFNQWARFIISDLNQDDFFITQHRYGNNVEARFLQVGKFKKSKGEYTPTCIPIGLPRLRNVISIRYKFRTSVQDVLSAESFDPLQMFNNELHHTNRQSKSENNPTTSQGQENTGILEEGYSAIPSSNDCAKTSSPNKASSSIPFLSEEHEFVKSSLLDLLLPLIFSEADKGKISLPDLFPYDSVCDTIIEIAKGLQSYRSKTLSKRLGTTVMSPTDQLQLPFFDHFGIDRYDKRLVENMVRDLVKLDIHGVKKSQNLLSHVDLGNGNGGSLVRVPQCGSLDRMRRNDRVLSFFKKFLCALIPPSTKKAQRQQSVNIDSNATHDFELRNEDDAMLATLVHFGKQSPSTFEKAIKWLGYGIGNPMDEVATFAMWASANVNYKQQREIARHLRIAFDKSLVAPEQKVKRLLGNNFVVPETGVYKKGNKNIDWSCSDPCLQLVYFITGVMNSSRRKEFTLVDVVVMCDHGKGFSRVILNFILRMKDDDGKWTELSETYLCSYAECEKDTRDIIVNTFGLKYNESVKKLKVSGGVDVFLSSIFNKEESKEEYGTKKYYAVLKGDGPKDPNDTLDLTIKGDYICSSDLSQYMLNYGREGFASIWCFWCNLSKAEWQKAGHAKGDPWTLEKLKAHREVCKEIKKTRQLTPNDIKGVKEQDPIFDCIDVDKTTTPILHLGLGVINDGVQSIQDELQAACEKWTDEYVQLEKYSVWLDADVKELRKSRDEYGKATKNRKKELEKKSKDKTIDETEKEELVYMVSFLDYLRKHAKLSGSKLKVAKRKIAKEMKKSENNKAHGQPVRAAMQKRMQENGVDCAVYFGGDKLQGGPCRKFVGERAPITSAWRDDILQLPDEQKYVNESEIFRKIDLHEELFGHIDALFSICRTKRYHLTNEQLESAKAHRDHVLALWRYLGLSVTPKLHCIEDHLIEFLERFGGLGDAGEDEGERGHQTGAQNESRSRNLRDNTSKARSQSSWEAMTKHEGVVEKRKAVNKEAERKRKKPRTETKAAADKRERDIGRSELLSSSSLVTGKSKTLREMRKEKILGELPKRNHSIWTKENPWSNERDEWTFPPLEDSEEEKDKT